MSQAPSTWPSSLSGYLDRATPYPDPANFKPPRSSLKFIVLRNAQAEPNGFTLAIFSSDGTSATDKTYATDSVGAVYTLQAEDAAKIQALSDKVAHGKGDEAPTYWTLKSRISCRPIEKLLFPKDAQGVSDTPAADRDTEFVEISVYGFNYVETKLREPTDDGRETLPENVWELTAVALEARKTREGAKASEDVLTMVKAMVYQ